jgi:hypothetical protein
MAKAKTNKCPAIVARAQREFQNMTTALADVERARGRIQSLRMYTKDIGTAKYAKSAKSAQAALSSALSKAKAASTKWQRIAAAYSKCA